MASMGTKMAVAGAAYQAQNAANSAAASAGNAGGSGAVEDSEEEEGDRRAEAKPLQQEEEKDSFFDDMMEGFAEIYRMTVGGGHTCVECMRKVAYPIKETCYSTYDGVAGHLAPTADARIGRGNAPPAPTFAHE
eukprot:TRINITY_DN41211_c0_g1_i2.p2 TRINITY_DN41211_c0_g1~~TRINITY_DN41211_c0_g1_i2.p2  ORF type:complete len:134 (+),score=29.31 TRINITY_DN41211_c0_g1_i2:108-509(+)